jgi:hypothetical protein
MKGRETPDCQTGVTLSERTDVPAEILVDLGPVMEKPMTGW